MGGFTNHHLHVLNTPFQRPAGLLRALLTAVAGAFLMPNAPGQTYTVTQIPALGGTQNTGLAIDNNGTVVGDYILSDGVTTHAMTYLNGTVVDIGTLPGGTNSYANGSNVYGNVVGNSDTSGVTLPNAFESTYAVITNLGTFGGTISYAFGVNSSGIVVGDANLAGDGSYHAFSYSLGTLTDLGTLGGSDSIAYAINTAGVIVGNANLTGDASHHAFSYSTKGVMTDLGTLGGANSTAFAINDSGTIVGGASTSSGAIHAFSLVSGGTMTDLGTIGGATGNSSAKGINSSGVIVGYSAVTGSTVTDAFIYTNGQMTDLNTLVSLTGVKLTGTSGTVSINDLGQIAVNGSDGRAYLLTPKAVHLTVSAPASVNQSTPFSVTVTAIDGSGNVATTYGGIVTLTSTDASAVLPANSVLTNGTATFKVTLGTAGTQTLTAADTVIPTVTGTTSSISVIHAIFPTFSVQPIPETVNLGANAVFWAVASGSAPLTYQWYLNGVLIPGATSPLLQDVAVGSLGAGSFSVTATNTAGSLSSSTALLSLSAAGSGNPLHFVSQPISQSAAGGSTVVFSATTAGSDGGPPTTYQWFQNGIAIPGTNYPELVIRGAGASNSGTYSCAAMNSSGAVLSGPATLSVLGGVSPGRLSNISCRAEVGSGAGELIVGLVVGPPGTVGGEPVLVRASGPALAQFGVTGFLPDPKLTVVGPYGVIASDNGWAGNSVVASVAASVGAFAWTSATSDDSAVVDALTDGPYTAQIAGSSGDSGISLAEVYDATPSGSVMTNSPRLINISARAQVGSGGNILIAGFVIGGTTSKAVLIRASGPALTAFGVGGVLADPELQLYGGNNNGTSTLIASDTGWGGDTQVASVAASVGAFSWGAFATPDSAILVSLPPGSYTAEVSGASGDQGVALIEVYEVP